VRLLHHFRDLDAVLYILLSAVQLHFPSNSSSFGVLLFTKEKRNVRYLSMFFVLSGSFCDWVLFPIKNFISPPPSFIMPMNMMNNDREEKNKTKVGE
jgi:hypothetical protein